MKNKQFKVLHRSFVAFHLPPPFTPKQVFVTSFTFEGVQTSQRLAHRGVFYHFTYDNIRDIKMINDRIIKKIHEMDEKQS